MVNESGRGDMIGKWVRYWDLGIFPLTVYADGRVESLRGDGKAPTAELQRLRDAFSSREWQCLDSEYRPKGEPNRSPPVIWGLTVFRDTIWGGGKQVSVARDFPSPDKVSYPPIVGEVFRLFDQIQSHVNVHDN